MNQVTSEDGTTIAYDRLGEGPPVVLVCGASVDRRTSAGFAQHLAADFTVFNYDRRGRGDSGDSQPYAIEREVEDIQAVIEAAGGAACLWGSSSGGVLGLIAAERGAPITKLALWEPPFVPEGVPGPPPEEQVEQYERMIAEDRRGDAVEYFMSKVVGMPPEFVAGARTQPFWAATEALAHTLAYDARVMADYRPPADAASVKVPTLVIAGGADIPWMRDAARMLAEALPEGQAQFLDGQGHDVDPSALAPVLKEFFR